MIRPTFMGLSTGVSGLHASQKSLDIVGNNISNVYTEGYTRQRVDTYATPTICGSRVYAYQTLGGSGLGVTIAGRSQVRDPYLDLRYRSLASKTGNAEVYMESQQDVEDVLSEINVDGIGSQFASFTEALNDLAENPGKPEFESLVKDAASTLVKEIRNASFTLDSIRHEREFSMQEDIDDMNQALADIAELNKTIKNETILGNEPLELIDERNLLIDKVSTLANVDVDYQQFETDSGGIKYTELKLSINGKTILDHNQYGQFSMNIDDATNEISISYEGGLRSGDFNEDRATESYENMEMDIKDGELRGYLDFLNMNGEFDDIDTGDEETQTVSTWGTRGLGYFEKRLDMFANSLANIVNSNCQNNMFVPDGDSDTVTASNIKIADGWMNDQFTITNTFKDLQGDSSGANDNLLYILTEFTKEREFDTEDGKHIYSGSLEEYISDIANTSHSEVGNAETMYNLKNAQMSTVLDLRDGMSAVSLNEEAVDMMKYQKSYNACAQYISAVNSILETLINNVGQVR